MIVVFFLYFWFFYGFFSKLLILLLTATNVSTEHQKWPKIGQNSLISPFRPKGKKASAKGQSSPQELEVGKHSFNKNYKKGHIFWVFFGKCKSDQNNVKI